MNPLLHTSKGVRLLAVAIACCVAVLAGCSDDESSDDTTTTSAAAETDETTPEDASTDTLPEITVPDTPLCQLANDQDPDLSGLPELLPEELRAEATQFAQEYEEWRASGDETAPPEAPQSLIDFITQECFSVPEDDAVDPDAPAG